MKRNFLMLALSVLLGISAVMGTSEVFARGGGGGGVPSPFTAVANHKVELADGELYLLQGKVMFDDLGQTVFWVDLKQEPWLANQERIRNPFYKLEGQREQWREFEGQTILVACIAKGAVVNGSGYEILLYPVDGDVSKAVAKPAVERREHDHR